MRCSYYPHSGLVVSCVELLVFKFHFIFHSVCMFFFLLKIFLCIACASGWFGSRVVSVLDSGAEGPGFKSQS